MNKFKSYLSGGIAPKKNARRPKAYRLWVTLASFGLALIATLVAARAEGPTPFRFSLVQASDAIAACLPNATAEVTIARQSEHNWRANPLSPANLLQHGGDVSPLNLFQSRKH